MVKYTQTIRRQIWPLALKGLKECSDETLSIFWKKGMYEKLIISEME